jgi:hypothetical protein
LLCPRHRFDVSAVSTAAPCDSGEIFLALLNSL